VVDRVECEVCVRVTCFDALVERLREMVELLPAFTSAARALFCMHVREREREGEKERPTQDREEEGVGVVVGRKKHRSVK
jgi:hypothetical protein